MKKITSFRSLYLSAALVCGTLAFSGCVSDSDGPTGDYSRNGVLISNEGAMGKSNASVSFYSHDNRSVENESFKKANGPLLLGDVLQHLSVHGDRAYLVMNNSGKITVANATTLKAEGEINGLDGPRYFTALNEEKGYATEWLAYNPETGYSPGRVAVIDLKTLTVTRTINVGVQPEQLLIHAGKLFVVNSGGNTVSVINTGTDALETSIQVTDGPNSLALDRNNILWISSNGLKVYDSNWAVSEEDSAPGALTKINPSDNAVIGTLTFSQKLPSPSKLTLNGNRDRLYYLFNNKVYVQEVNATTLAAQPLVDRGPAYTTYGFYGLAVDPGTGMIYAGKAPNFESNGWVVRYNNQSGAPVDSFQVGMAPNGFVFR